MWLLDAVQNTAARKPTFDAFLQAQPTPAGNAEEPNAHVLPSYAPRLRRPVIKFVVPLLVSYPTTLYPRSVDNGLEDVTAKRLVSLWTKLEVP